MYSFDSPAERQSYRKKWKPRQLILTDKFDVVLASSVYKMFDALALPENDPTDVNTWFIWAKIATEEEEDEYEDGEDGEDGEMKMDVDMQAPQGETDGKKGNDVKEGASTSDVDMQPAHDEEADQRQVAKDRTISENAHGVPTHEAQQSEGTGTGTGSEKGQEDSQEMSGMMPTGDVNLETALQRRKKDQHEQDEFQEGEVETRKPSADARAGQKEVVGEEEEEAEAEAEGKGKGKEAEGKGKGKEQEQEQDTDAQEEDDREDEDKEDGEKKQKEKDLDASRRIEQPPQDSRIHSAATAPMTPAAVVEKPCPPAGSLGPQQGQTTGGELDGGGAEGRWFSAGRGDRQGRRQNTRTPQPAGESQRTGEER